MERKDDRFEVGFGPDGSTDIGAKAGVHVPLDDQELADHHLELLTACSEGTTDDVFYVYYGMRTDPERRTFPEVVRDCFEQEGVPDGRDLGDAEFAELILPEDGEVYTPSTPEGQACVDDPYAQLGLGAAGGG